MQATATALITLGGLLLSLSCAVLLEELLLGGLFRLFFAPRRDRVVPAFRPAYGNAKKTPLPLLPKEAVAEATRLVKTETRPDKRLSQVRTR